MRRAPLAIAVVLAVPAAACVDDRPFFDRQIEPILTARCTRSGAGACHTDDGTGRAQGNLDLTSYEMLSQRPDVLRRYGSYPLPLLLLKATADPPAVALPVNVGDGMEIPLAVRHAGGAIFSLDDPEFTVLDRWLQNGATRDGEPAVWQEVERGPCTPDLRTDLFAQPTLDAVDVESPGYLRFTNEVWPILRGDDGFGCLGRECHGARDSNRVPTIELYFTCGDDDRQRRFNYLMARTYSGATGRGQLTEKVRRGASFHYGGTPFDSVGDPRYRTLVDWSASDPPFTLQEYEGEPFFRVNVQPVLVARGCYFEACHSLVNFNFYKPLAGTDGLYGTRVMQHNYLQARFMLGVGSSDPRKGRLLEKNLMPSAEGIPHRGGPLLAPLGPCAPDLDAVRADPTRLWREELTAGCVLATWHLLERAIAVDAGQVSAVPGATGVFVRRPPNPDRHIDFDTYRPGADLLRLDFTVDAGGRITGLAGAPTSLLAGCGVDPAVADVRRPDITGDGGEILFAMRTSASEGLALWTVNATGDACRRLDLPTGTDAAGTPIHHFDPAYGPSGVIVFASTMGDATHPDPARRYPSRTPKHFLPKSNIWVLAPGGQPRRLSYLNGAQLAPRLLHTREVIYAVEKAAPDFYQISTRAVRLDDGGGYRPQRGQRPTMGFGQVTEMREMIDFRSVFIGSDPGTWFGGGTLVVDDLSLGLEELAFGDDFFHPTQVLDAGAAARPGEAGTGVYRSPAPLPDGRILVAYSPGEVDLGDPNAAVDYGLWIVDPEGLAPPALLLDTPGQFDVEPAVALERVWVPQPNRIHQGDPARGEYVFHSIPLFAALLNDNARTGTEPDPRVAAVRVLEQLPPPEGATTPEAVAADLHGPEQVYVKRRLIGEAPLLADGSLRIMVPASTPVILELLDESGATLDWQREEEHIGPGETQPRLVPVAQFNAICGGCHNALDGSELGVAISADAFTGASVRSQAARAAPVDLVVPPELRPEVPYAAPP